MGSGSFKDQVLDVVIQEKGMQCSACSPTAFQYVTVQSSGRCPRGMTHAGNDPAIQRWGKELDVPIIEFESLKLVKQIGEGSWGRVRIKAIVACHVDCAHSLPVHLASAGCK